MNTIEEIRKYVNRHELPKETEEKTGLTLGETKLFRALLAEGGEISEAIKLFYEYGRAKGYYAAISVISSAAMTEEFRPLEKELDDIRAEF